MKLDKELLDNLFDAEGKEVERIHLDPSTGNFGCVVPANTWHTVEVFEPSVIFEGMLLLGEYIIGQVAVGDCGSRNVELFRYVATKDCDAYGIYQGVPAGKVKERVIEEC